MNSEKIIMENSKKRTVYICGAKGVSMYGGFESFLQKLLEYHKDYQDIQYRVACKANGEGHMDVSKLKGASAVKDGGFKYYGAECFLVHVPDKLGSAQAIFYDVKSIKEICKHIEENHIENAIVYVLACRIGPLFNKYVKKIHSMNGKVYVNPDGHEWKRAKWSALVRKYWKESERLMVKDADLLICDSINIEKYIQEEYSVYKPKTIFIAYGSDTIPSTIKEEDPKYIEWLKEHGLKANGYYVSVGRFVPENNFETMIREFMKSKTVRDFAIITTNNPKFQQKLDQKLHFSQDKRIKFVGAIYDQELLKKIRENAYVYFHGHSVGGTNPSLLEALGSTKLNLLLDVGFNKEVAQDAAMYWSKEKGNLTALIDKADQLSQEEIDMYGEKAKARIRSAYSWEFIADRYRKLFTE